MLRFQEKELYLKKARRLSYKISNFLNELSKYGNSSIQKVGKKRTIEEIIIEVKDFINKVNVNKIEDSLETSTINFQGTDRARAILLALDEKLSEIIGLLETQIRPQLSINETQILSGFREDISKIKGNSEELLIKNLNLALEELEQMHCLSCSIISARLTLYMVEKIEGKNDKESFKKT